MHQFLTVIDQTSDVLYDLTTVEKVNAEFKLVSSPANDAAVQADITENSRILAELCGRVFALQTVIETFRVGRRSDYCGNALNLSRYPVTDFQSLTIGGAEVDPSSYEIDTNAGILYRLQGYWPYSSYLYPQHAKIVATYTGGYNLPDGAPAALGRACIESIRDDRMLSARSLHPGVQDVWAGDNRVRYFDLNVKASTGAYITGVSAMIEGLISPYRRLAV
jgi:hypothetical protein